MTEIVYEKNPDITEVTVFGHCNAGRINGMDLCCCAVSMLVFTMLDTLRKLRLNDFRHSYGGGWCHVRFKNTGSDYKKAKYTLETVMNGFNLLKKRYPSNISIIEKGSEVKAV